MLQISKRLEALSNLSQATTIASLALAYRKQKTSI
jgi:hypothetical protein